MLMSRLYFEIFDQTRKEVFQKLSGFKKIGVLGGGTAISLQLGSRYSYDFDIFSSKLIAKNILLQALDVFGLKIKKLIDTLEELSFITNQGVKVSFVHFPFLGLHPTVETESLKLFSLSDLASNKAYVIGRRGEYRDYVDLFFLLKNGLKLRKIVEEAEKRFRGAFSERLFLEQLFYFKDLKDFKIDFLKEKYSPSQIKAFLKKAVEGY